MKRLVLDVDDWTRAGEELLEVDPGRFAAILAVVRDIVELHRDPIRGARDNDTASIVAAVGAKRGAA